MDRLSHILPEFLRKRGIAHHAQAALVVHRTGIWLQEHLPAVSPYARVLQLKQETLEIACTNATVAQELQSASVDLLAFLRAECPGVAVTEVRISRR